tara:strand:- start:3934 stop:4266 length:333 start_codon:yes stop_codon:yes gene_type:complete
MIKITLQNLGPMLKKKRGDRGIRETSKEIGISSATLSRVENGKPPDLNTFPKVCKWLQVDPGEILGYKVEKREVEAPAVYAHFRADKNLSSDTAHAIGEMILAAQKMTIK